MTETPKSTTSDTSTPSHTNSQPSTSSSYLSYPVSHTVSSLYRRLTEPSPNRPNKSKASSLHSPSTHSLSANNSNDIHTGVYTPPNRTASPFQPPPLTPLTLSGATPSTILSKAVAEEIRLLVPPRLQLADTWSIAYSLEGDGVSLGTLYNKCSSAKLPRNTSFVLVVQDAAGGIFGAYLTDPPKPSPSFYGTGECFLWRASLLPSTSASLLANLPPLPSAPESETEAIGRSTTISSPHRTSSASDSSAPQFPSISSAANNGHDRSNMQNDPAQPNPSDSSQPPQQPLPPPDLLRFKAFPYSGVNDYLIFCEPSFLSVGGGDGKYGLWLDGVLERGISSHCMTFGNEALSEEGEKFEVVGVEVWCVGGH
ncbi:oxidation resistance protein 1 [Lecanora helva]